MDVQEFLLKWGLDDRVRQILMDLSPEVQSRAMADFAPKHQTKNINSLFTGFCKSIAGPQSASAHDLSPQYTPADQWSYGQCESWCFEKGLDSWCLKSLMSLPGEHRDSVMAGFAPNKFTKNPSSVFMSYVRSMASGPKVASKGGGKGYSTPGDLIRNESFDGQCESWCLEKNLDSFCLESLMSLPCEHRDSVMAGFALKEHTKNPSSLFMSYVRSMASVPKSALKGAGKGYKGSLDRAAPSDKGKGKGKPSTCSPAVPQKDDALGRFVTQWQLDEESYELLAQQPHSVQEEMMNTFSPKAGTRNVQKLFLGFLRSVSKTHGDKQPSLEVILEEEVCPPTQDVEVLVAPDDKEALDIAEPVLAKDQPLKPLKCAEDTPSTCDSGDIATVAPSSCYTSDDEEGSLICSSVNSHALENDKGTPSQYSERSRSRAVSFFNLDEPQEPSAASPFACLLSTSEESDSQPESEKSEAMSPMSWAAQQRLRKSSADISRWSRSTEVSASEIAHKARALLNKLTHDRFESLCTQVLALPLSTPEHLTSLTAEIFDKATTQHGFRSLYTELCLRLDAHFAGQSTAIGGKTFRNVLLSQCQAAFERNAAPGDPALFAGLCGDEPFELEMKLKTRRLGNMKFIGELIVRGLLSQKLMPPIIEELLAGDEVALESLVAFLTIVAPCFDQKASLYQTHLHDAFATLRHKKNDKDLSKRLRCHLSDLFDARAKGWAA